MTWMSIYIPHDAVDVITYAWPNLCQFLFRKGVPGISGLICHQRVTTPCHYLSTQLTSINIENQLCVCKIVYHLTETIAEWYLYNDMGILLTSPILCVWNQSVTGAFPAQLARNTGLWCFHCLILWSMSRNSSVFYFIWIHCGLMGHMASDILFHIDLGKGFWPIGCHAFA